MLCRILTELSQERVDEKDGSLTAGGDKVVGLNSMRSLQVDLDQCMQKSDDKGRCYLPKL